jgi:hypothetical protein
MRNVGGRFQLKGGVFDVEVLGQALLQGVENLGGVTAVKAVVFDDHVGRQGGLTGRYGPRVQVVDVEHVAHSGQVCANVVQIEIVGGGLEENLPGVA